MEPLHILEHCLHRKRYISKALMCFFLHDTDQFLIPGCNQELFDFLVLGNAFQQGL